MFDRVFDTAQSLIARTVSWRFGGRVVGSGSLSGLPGSDTLRGSTFSAPIEEIFR